MKGIVFIALRNYIETNFGYDMWESILQKISTSPDEVYVSIENYSDQSLFEMVEIIKDTLQLSKQKVLNLFGEDMFVSLSNKHPKYTVQCATFLDFILSIEGTIHKEVKKLYDEPQLPTFKYEKHGDNKLLVEYHSKRKLCFLAEGLIKGAADYYNEAYRLQHIKCMHKGDDNCVFDIEVINGYQ